MLNNCEMGGSRRKSFEVPRSKLSPTSPEMNSLWFVAGGNLNFGADVAGGHA